MIEIMDSHNLIELFPIQSIGEDSLMMVELNGIELGCLIRKHSSGWHIFSPKIRHGGTPRIYAQNDETLLYYLTQTPLNEPMNSIFLYPFLTKIDWKGHFSSLIKTELDWHDPIFICATCYDAPFYKQPEKATFMGKDFLNEKDLLNYIKNEIIFFYGTYKNQNNPHYIAINKRKIK